MTNQPDTLSQGPVGGGHDPDFMKNVCVIWRNVNHHAPSQIQRQQRADTTIPIYTDANEKRGQFRGSLGEKYAVSLTGCSCHDFTRRRQPCKHMYRLVKELMRLASLQQSIEPHKHTTANVPLPPSVQTHRETVLVKIPQREHVFSGNMDAPAPRANVSRMKSVAILLFFILPVFSLFIGLGWRQ